MALRLAHLGSYSVVWIHPALANSFFLLGPAVRYVVAIPVLIHMMGGSLAAAPVLRQGFDPLVSANGWARVDKDGSCTFYDGASRRLQTWIKDLGITGGLDLSRLNVIPEKWVLDPYGNAWVVAGTTLYQVDKTGKPGNTVKLPGEVTDVAWDTKGFVLIYRGGDTFMEKREYGKASTLWTVGKKSKNDSLLPDQRIAVAEDGNVLVATGASLFLRSYGAAKGVPLGESVFTLSEATPPTLSLGGRGRGALCWWLGKGVAFAAVPASQVPSEKKTGLLLARLDLANGTVDFLPTGVTEDHQLLGILDTEAVLEKPSGGLILVPVK